MKIIFLVLLLIVCFQSFFINNQPIELNKSSIKSISEIELNKAIKVENSKINIHSPINISGNDDFQAKAISEGWPGDGSKDNPIILENLELHQLSGYQIKIVTTTLFFIIRNSSIKNGLKGGLFLQQVQNGLITQNYFNNNSGTAISIADSEKILISNNIIQYTKTNIILDLPFDMPALNGVAVEVIQSSEIQIKNNILSNNYNGIWFSSKVLYSSIENNYIENHNRSGIGISFFDHISNLILNNTIKNMGHYGIWLYEVDGTTFIHNNTITNATNGLRFSQHTQHSNTIIQNNTIFNSRGKGMKLSGSRISVIANQISNSQLEGISINGFFNDISYNHLINNTLEALLIFGNNMNITFNFFVNNNNGSIQATDISTSDSINQYHIVYNYWSDLTSPDLDNDGIVDVPYIFNRPDFVNSEGAKDQYPLVEMTTDIKTEKPTTTSEDLSSQTSTQDNVSFILLETIILVFSSLIILRKLK
ncbi:MAG: right-handed parallel beta-helix repeat-containing protein [Candidatus Hodarchaeales archaeon]|jgi:parallel beta-helix repeat protein